MKTYLFTSLWTMIALACGSCDQVVTDTQTPMVSKAHEVVRQAQVCIQLVGQSDWACTN